MKWKDFRVEHNSWEPWDYVNAPDLIAEFYRNHPEAARHIRSIEFQSLPFQSIEVPRCHFLKGGVDLRGLPIPSKATNPAHPWMLLCLQVPTHRHHLPRTSHCISSLSDAQVLPHAIPSLLLTPDWPEDVPALRHPFPRTNLCLYTYGLISFIYSLLCHSIYLSLLYPHSYLYPCPSSDPHSFLFGSPAR